MHESHKILKIHQYTENFAGGQRQLANASIRFDDIDHTEVGSVKILTQLYMQILNGLLNVFIATQLIMTCQAGLSKYTLNEPIRFILTLVVGFCGLDWLYNWIRQQFIDGVKTLVVKLNGHRAVELVYDDDLRKIINEAKTRDFIQTTDDERAELDAEFKVIDDTRV